MHKRAVIDWMNRRGLITDNEYLAGKALAVLIEWRVGSYGADSSPVVFARKFWETPPEQIPYECPLLVMEDEESGGSQTIDLDEFRFGARVTRGGVRTGLLHFNETIRERLSRHVCAYYELRRVADLLRRALPERPDLMVILGHAVTERVGVREIPYTDVPLLCAALHTVKELWRYDLLEDAIDEACGHTTNSAYATWTRQQDERRTPTAHQHSRPERIPATARERIKTSRYEDRHARTQTREPLQDTTVTQAR